MRINLTDRFIKSRPAAPAGERIDYADAIVPGLVLRVTDRGHKSFALRARYPLQPKNPTRRALGNCYIPNEGEAAPSLEIRHGTLTLAEARQKAREWLDLIGKGIDPKVEEECQRAAARRHQANTFACVAQDFLDQHAAKLAKSAEAERIIKGEFVGRWAGRPITDIAKEEVSAAILAIVKRGARYQARNSFSLLRLLFNWAIGQGAYGIDTSPLERLSVKALCGASEARERTLTGPELRAVWNAAGQMGFPYGPCFRLLILTGQREREISDMSWSEVDLDQEMLTIPATRTKADRAHEIPLAPVALDLLKSLRRFTGGNFIFTTTAGKKSINGFSKAKMRIDRLSGVTGWKIHDLRRTMRTHLSALPVQDLVRELVIGHAKKGLHRVYDRHLYQSEKRHCLELWEKRLLAIVEPPEGENIVKRPDRLAEAV